MYPGEYLDPDYHPFPRFLPSDVYAQALDSLVLTCVDIVVTYQGKMLLGKRCLDPQSDWWIVGGRMRPGERFAESAVRLLKTELDLSIITERFRFCTLFSAAWSKRAHEPVDRGTHTVSIVLTVELTKYETMTLMPNNEYQHVSWRDPAEVAADLNLHPAVRQCAAALKEHL